MTCASCSMRARAAPVARLSVVHTVSTGVAWPQARSASRRACGATPTMPTSLSARAAMMPATAVPWSSAARPAPSTKFALARDLAGEVGMVGLHAAVDHGDAHVASGRDGVQLVQAARPRGRLQANSGSSWPRVGTRSSAGPRRRADRAPAPAPRLRRAAAGRHVHHEAVQAEQRHRPVGDQLRPLPRASAAATRRRAARRPRRHSRPHSCRRGGSAPAAGAAAPAPGAALRPTAAALGRRRRRCADATGRAPSSSQATERPHRAASPSSDSTSSTAGLRAQARQRRRPGRRPRAAGRHR